MQFPQSLTTILKSRQIAPSAPALEAELRRRGLNIHQNTLRSWLNGSRRPKRSTITEVLTALNATAVEREMVIASLDTPERSTSSSTLSLLRALGGVELVNKGREKEEVVWRYRIGTTSAGDFCVETRRTQVGADPLRLAAFGPGQMGTARFDLSELPLMELKVTAQRLKDGLPAGKIPTFLHVVELQPNSNQFQMVVQFAGVQPGELIEWATAYRWPGLWESLRVDGTSAGSLNIRGSNPIVTRMAVEIEAPQTVFPDLELVAVSEARTRPKRTVGDQVVQWRWSVPNPSGPLRFELRSAERAQGSPSK